LSAHQKICDLLALRAPRPVMLGNARHDVWSDPNGTFRATQAASPAWSALGKVGLSQERFAVCTGGEHSVLDPPQHPRRNRRRLVSGFEIFRCSFSGRLVVGWWCYT